MDDKNQYQNWKDEVLNSLDGMQRAKPRADLFSEIESKISNSKLQIIPKSQFRLAVAATITLLIINLSLVMNYANTGESSANSIKQETNSGQLISDYNLYK